MLGGMQKISIVKKENGLCFLNIFLLIPFYFSFSLGCNVFVLIQVLVDESIDSFFSFRLL